MKCTEIVREGDWEKYISTLMAPDRYRRQLIPIYAFNHEIARIVYNSREPMISEIKLRWWEDELTKGLSDGITVRHEILNPLLKIAVSKQVPLELFLNILNARRFDLSNEQHKSLDEQVDYITNVFSSLFEICLRSCISSIDEAQIKCVRNYGFAYGVANLFLSLSKLESLGKKPIFIRENANSQTGTGYQTEIDYNLAIRNLADVALVSLREARLKLKTCDRNIVSVMYCVAYTEKILKYVRRIPECLKTERVYPSLVYRRISLLTARVRKYL